MTPPPNLGHSLVVFEGCPQILPWTKLFRHGFEQSCSAMVTQKLEEKVQQHDEDAESSKTGCSSQSRAHGKAYKQVSKCLHWSATPMPAASCAHLPFLGAIWLIWSKIAPSTIWGTNLKLPTWISSFHHPPSIIFAFNTKWGNPPLPNPSFPYEYICMYLKWTFLKWPF